MAARRLVTLVGRNQFWGGSGYGVFLVLRVWVKKQEESEHAVIYAKVTKYIRSSDTSYGN